MYCAQQKSSLFITSTEGPRFEDPQLLHSFYPRGPKTWGTFNYPQTQAFFSSDHWIGQQAFTTYQSIRTWIRIENNVSVWGDEEEAYVPRGAERKIGVSFNKPVS